MPEFLRMSADMGDVGNLGDASGPCDMARGHMPYTPYRRVGGRTVMRSFKKTRDAVQLTVRTTSPCHKD